MRKIAIMGAGGLGRAAVRLLEKKSEFKLVAMADSKAIVHRKDGITSGMLASVPEGESLLALEGVAVPCVDAAAEILRLNREGAVDAVFLAVPNIPNSFIPELIARFCREGFKGVLVDALKRTTAVEQILKIETELGTSGVLYVTGAGATPGLLTAAANLAAQSFEEVHDVKIWFGVGMASWENYRATIREDIAHMPGYNIEKVKALSDTEIEKILDDCNGLIELHGMEHADDILLERAGVVTAERVSVGGLVDTRRAVKPTATRMTLRGRTFEGKESEHTFTLGNDTSMAANVLGPAFGWMKAGLELHDRGIRGLFSSADLMPKFVK